MLEYNRLNFYDAEFPEDIKKVILNFASENHIEINSRFWDIGDLREEPSLLPAQFGGGKNYEGNDNEKQRYKSIKDLYWDIEEYNEYKEFFISIDEKYYVNLVVTNNGNTFDEDIDVKLIVDNGVVIHPEDITLPGINIIEDILKMNVIEYVYKVKSNDIISPYPDYPNVIPNYRYDIPSPFGKSDHEEYEEQKEQFEDDINRVFCYKYYYRFPFNFSL